MLRFCPVSPWWRLLTWRSGPEFRSGKLCNRLEIQSRSSSLAALLDPLLALGRLRRIHSRVLQNLYLLKQGQVLRGLYAPNLVSAPLPTGYEGEFGPHLKSLLFSHLCNRTEPKIADRLSNLGILIPAAQYRRGSRVRTRSSRRKSRRRCKPD
jgi:hypothetical protein